MPKHLNFQIKFWWRRKFVRILYLLQHAHTVIIIPTFAGFAVFSLSSLFRFFFDIAFWVRLRMQPPKYMAETLDGRYEHDVSVTFIFIWWSTYIASRLRSHRAVEQFNKNWTRTNCPDGCTLPDKLDPVCVCVVDVCAQTTRLAWESEQTQQWRNIRSIIFAYDLRD